MMIINFERTCPKCGGFGSETTCQGCGKILAQDEWVCAIENEKKYTVKNEVFLFDAVFTGAELISFAKDFVQPFDFIGKNENVVVAEWLMECNISFVPIQENNILKAS